MWKGLFGGKQASKQNERTCRTSLLQFQRSQRQVEDPEEDGFVLVGETAIERSTVGPQHVGLSTYQDEPPSYDSQVNRTSYNPLTSYTPYFSALNMGQGPSNLVTTEVSPEYVREASSDPITDINLTNTDRERNADSHPGRLDVSHTPRANTSCSFVSTLPGEIIEDDTFTATQRFPVSSVNECPLRGVPFKLATRFEYLDTDWSGYDCIAIPNLNIADFEYDFSLERNAVRDSRHVFPM